MMDRQDFLKVMGFGAASLALAACFGGCKKDGETAPSSIDISLDLSQSAYAALSQNGGYVYTNGLIVARTLAGEYIAVSKTCTHEGGTVIYQGSNSRFYCSEHGATFSNTGTVTGGPATKSLQQYNTSLSGTVLRVYS